MKIQLMLDGQTVVEHEVRSHAETYRENLSWFLAAHELSKHRDPVPLLVKLATRVAYLASEQSDAAALAESLVQLRVQALMVDAALCGPDATDAEIRERFDDLCETFAARLDDVAEQATVHRAAASPPPADKQPPVTPIAQPTPELMPAATPAAKPVEVVTQGTPDALQAAFAGVTPWMVDRPMPTAPPPAIPIVPSTDAELRTWIGRRVTDSHAVDLWFKVRDYTRANGALVGMAMRVSRELDAPSYQAVHRLISMLDKHNLVDWSRKPTSTGTEWTITGVRYPTWLR